MKHVEQLIHKKRTTFVIHILYCTYNTLVYIVFSILDAHAKETRVGKDGKKPTVTNGWVKDRLQEHVNLFPPVLGHLAEHRPVCPIGCGTNPDLTFQQMVDKYGEHEARSATSPDERRVATLAPLKTRLNP